MITHAELADALTIPNVIAWLETQSVETEFDYCDSHDCLLSRYIKHKFSASQADKVSCNPFRFRWNDIEARIDANLDTPIRTSNVTNVWTYGAALEALKNVNRASS